MKLVKSILIVTGLLATQNVLASKFEVVGEGVATTSAEFLKVQIGINSECFQNATEARSNAEKMTLAAKNILADFANVFSDQTSIAVKANLQKVKTAYVGNETVVICDQNHSWTSGNTIHFKLKDIADLARLQDQLLGLNPVNQSVQKNAPQLQLTIAQPEAGVTADKWNEISDLALKRAQINALRQVQVLTSENAGAKIQLQKVTATKESSGQIIYDQVTNEGDSSLSGLGSVSVKISRAFTFSVE